MTFLTWVPTTTICGSWMMSAPTVLNTSCSLFMTGMRASMSSDTISRSRQLSLPCHTRVQSHSMSLGKATGVSLDLPTTAHTVVSSCIMGVWVQHRNKQNAQCRGLTFHELRFPEVTCCTNEKKGSYFSSTQQ